MVHEEFQDSDISVQVAVRGYADTDAAGPHVTGAY
jgi:hypothetical protein